MLNTSSTDIGFESSTMIAIDDLTACIWVYDIDNFSILWANEPALNLWESDTLDELKAIDFRPMTSAAVQSSLLEYKKSFEQGIKITHNWHFAPKGIDKHAFCQISGYPLSDGRMAMLVEAIPISKVNYDTQVGLTTMISSYSMEGHYLSSNPTFMQAVGRSISNIKQLFVEPEDHLNFLKALSREGRFEGDVKLKVKTGQRWYHIVAIHPRGEEGKNASILLHQFDINRRKIAELALEQESLTDPLTELLNRRGLEKTLAALERKQHSLIIFYIDLDGFKLINDSYGHDVGDEVLKEVTRRLSQSLLSLDNHFLCRYGGDEFILGLQISNTQIDHDVMAKGLIKTLSASYQSPDGNTMELSASIGVAKYPEDTNNFRDIVICADAAMYEAKNTGKHRWVRYVKGMRQALQRHSEVVQSLYSAEKNDELKVFYQPIWDFTQHCDGKVIGFEALLRWNNQVLDNITTEEAIKVAEKIRIIDDIEQWVINRALSDLTTLRQYSNGDVTMAINLSTLHVLDKNFPEFLSQMLNDHQLEAKDLIIELKEKTLMEDLKRQQGTVEQLLALGVNISIDDFGQGQSSLAHLHQYPVNYVKIDGSFVQQLEHSKLSLKHLHELIKAHKIQVLIEGVETEKQKKCLLDLGIHLQQGYYLGKPQALSYYQQASLESTLS